MKNSRSCPGGGRGARPRGTRLEALIGRTPAALVSRAERDRRRARGRGAVRGWRARARGPRAAGTQAHDLAALRAHPDYPGRGGGARELFGAAATLPGRVPGAAAVPQRPPRRRRPRATEPWARDPCSGAVEDGRLHGRGSVDMKGAVIAALHALAAVPRRAARGRRRPAGGRLRGGRRPRHLRGARGRRGLRRRLIPEPTGFESRARRRAR